MNPMVRWIAGLLCCFAWPAVAGAGWMTMEVLDRAEGRVLPVHRHAGRHYVVGHPGNEYRVRLTNRSGEELLAVVSVDGVNVITGETAQVQQSGYVIGAGRSLEIPGWRKSLAQTAAFYFTAQHDAYASRTGRPDHLGVIGVAVFRKKPAHLADPIAQPFDAPRRRFESGAAPAYDDSMPREAAQGSAGRSESERTQGRASGSASGAPTAPQARLGTGHGRRVDAPARQVAFERATQQPAQVLRLYYDSRSNLLARGVLPRPRPFDPQPFPGFVPDPSG